MKRFRALELIFFFFMQLCYDNLFEVDFSKIVRIQFYIVSHAISLH